METIVVDGNSSDDSPAIAAEMGVKLYRGSFRRSSARRFGAENAAGEYLLFIDSDQTAGPTLLTECVELCEKTAVGAVRVPERDVAKGIWARVRRIDWTLTESDEIWYPRFFSHPVYDSVGKHALALEDYMEDRDIYLRLIAKGVKIGRCETPVFNQYGHFNPLEFGIKRGKAADDAVEYYKRNKKVDKSVWSVIRPRISRMVNSRVLSWKDIPFAYGLPAYVTVAYGPRLIRALRASRRARLVATPSLD